jgi:hypothetical protein
MNDQRVHGHLLYKLKILYLQGDEVVQAPVGLLGQAQAHDWSRFH